MEQVKLLSWIILGLLIARNIAYLNKNRIDGVRKFAFNYLTPCLFFLSVYHADLSLLPSPQLLLTYGLCFGTLFITLRLWLLTDSKNNASCSTIKAISALYPNAIGIGVPLVFSLYGAKAELILTGIVVTNLIVVLPLINVMLIRSGEPGFYTYRKVATDPIILSIVAGLLFNIAGIDAPPLVLNSLAVVSWIALPVILFILGASLSFYKFKALIQEKVLPLLLVKVVLFPLFTLFIATYVFHLNTIETQVLVILASLPTGLNVYLLSERYQVAKVATANVILFTTLFSLISLTAWEIIISHLTT